MTFEPRHLERRSGFVRFEDASGLEYEVHGDESRLEVAFELAASIASVLTQAESLLRDFIKHAGTYSPDFVEILAERDDEGAVCYIRHSFVADADPHDFRYTSFDVYFKRCEPLLQRFWPGRFVVGFW